MRDTGERLYRSEMRRDRAFLAAGALAIAAVAGLVGIKVGRSQAFELYTLQLGIRHAPPREVRADLQSLTSQHNPVERPCPTRARILVVAGQSNAGNHSEPNGYRAPPNVVNFYAGKCYEARDPLLGATGTGGAIWGRMAARLVGNVVIAPVSVGGTQIMQWAPGGLFHQNLIATVQSLKASDMEPTAILWQQGEGDYYTPGTEYAEDLGKLIASVKHETPAPFYAALSTRCQKQPSDTIRAAVRSAVAATGARMGPDTDTLGAEFRRDGCHFNAKGLDTASDLWARAIAGR